MDTCNQLALVKRLGQVIVGTEAEALYLLIRFGKPREDEDRRSDLGCPQPPQDFISVHIRQHEVENNQVVIVNFPDLETVFAEIRTVTDVTFGLQHHFDGFRCRSVVFD